jgi:hypothetical protein
MKERPILFQGDMVKAILDGRKTQTRRLLSHQPDPAWTGIGIEYIKHATRGDIAIAIYDAYPGRGTARHGICECPYGGRWHGLWIKETFWTNGVKPTEANFVIYDLEHSQGQNEVSRDRDGNMQQGAFVGTYKRFPSIVMPRWASRLTLEITGVRVQRLQEISYDDCKAEGVKPSIGRGMEQFNLNDPRVYYNTYSDLWNQINGPGSWDKNPWIWAITFRRT